MTMCPHDPKVSKRDAAQRLAGLFQEYGIGRSPSNNEAAQSCVVNMFEQRWPLLRVLAHQLHDAMEAETTKSTPAEPLTKRTWTRTTLDIRVIVPDRSYNGPFVVYADNERVPIVTIQPVYEAEAEKPITEKRLLDSIAKVNARATDIKAELLGDIRKLREEAAADVRQTHNALSRMKEQIRERSIVDDTKAELLGKIEKRATPKFEEGKTYRTRKNRTAQLCDDHSGGLMHPYRVFVMGNVHWAAPDGSFGEDQMLPGAIEDQP